MVIIMFDDRKIIITSKNISVFSYDNLLEIGIDYIIVDNIKINGTNLRIKEMDEYIITISGLISEVKFIE